jgi:anti-sigma B factor antagonist
MELTTARADRWMAATVKASWCADGDVGLRRDIADGRACGRFGRMQAHGSPTSSWRQMSLHEHVHPRSDRSAPRAQLFGLAAASESTRSALPEPFDVEIRPARHRVIVVPRGELDLATTDRVADDIDALVEAGFDEIVLDLRAVSFMDSTGLRLVIRQAYRPDARVRIVDGPTAVARLFDLTGTRAQLPFLAPREVRAVR